MGGWIGGFMDGVGGWIWMGGYVWADGWVGGWMYGWIGGWVGGNPWPYFENPSY